MTSENRRKFLRLIGNKYYHNYNGRQYIMLSSYSSSSSPDLKLKPSSDVWKDANQTRPPASITFKKIIKNNNHNIIILIRQPNNAPERRSAKIGLGLDARTRHRKMENGKSRHKLRTTTATAVEKRSECTTLGPIEPVAVTSDRL